MEVVNEKNCRLASVVVCCVLTVLSFFIFVPIAVVSGSADGSCVLYADTSEFGPDAACAFPQTVSILCQLIYCAARVVVLILLITGIISKQQVKNNVFLFGCGTFDVISAVLTLISGGIVSHGVSLMCSGIFQSHSDRCGELPVYNVATSSFIDFHLPLNVAQGGVWVSLVCWLLLIPLDVFLLTEADLLTLSWPLSCPFSLPHRPKHVSGTGSDVRQRGPKQSEDGDSDVFMTSHSRTGSGLTAANIQHTHRGWSPVPTREDSPAPATPPKPTWLPAVQNRDGDGGPRTSPKPTWLPAVQKGDRDGDGGPRTPPGHRTVSKTDSGSLPRTPPPTRPVPPCPVPRN